MSECWNNFHYIGMLHIFARVIGYAQLIACIRIKIGATEVALEPAEAVVVVVVVASAPSRF